MIHLDPPELSGPRRRRFAGAAEALAVEGWLLSTSLGVRMATGAWSDRTDLTGEVAFPVVAAGDAVVESVLPAGDPRFLEQFVDLLPASGRVAVDRLTLAGRDALARARPGVEVVDAAPVLGAARNPKDPAEVAVIVEGHHRTEAALRDVLGDVEPGVSERELNARFAIAAVGHGLTEMHVDTVFTVLPRHRTDAAWARGEWEHPAPYRELTSDRTLAAGDHVAFDAGFLYQGYMTDVGWTLLVGCSPGPAQLRLADRWRQVAERVVAALRPGSSAADARVAALRGWPSDLPRPWPHGLYVAHGIGLGGVEPPFVGADFDAEAERAMPVVEGQVVLVEPYVFEDGVGGYRAEYAVAVGADGAEIVNSLDVGRWHNT